ncbi:MAG TPA: fumarylacetoacetate hydrolase family protein [Labilithrix sp.]|jgi:2-keto-4-pentenoate hydratase/2-oxohepta-3-ene-1,7-dioic acid hydratase in catechol pathway
MRIARLTRDGTTDWYALEGAAARRFVGSPFAGAALEETRVSWTDAELAAPVVPSKIVCVGRNYVAHAKELGNEPPKEPLLFFKPPSAIVGPGARVELPKESERVEHEAELGVVIGKRVRRVAKEHALDAVFGYTCVNDVTARDLQKKDGQWARAKGFDGFCPVGPWIETGLDLRVLTVQCLIDGKLVQDGRTSDMTFDVATLISYISNIMTLEPGDLIATGTPEGVSPLKPGNRVTVAIDGIGELSVTVSSPSPSPS